MPWLGATNRAYSQTAAGFQVRFNSGHWVAMDSYNASLATIQSTINGLPTAIKGIVIPVTWAKLEAAQGNYSAGFTYLDTIHSYCAALQNARGTPFTFAIYINPDGSGNYPSYVDSLDGGLGSYVTPQSVKVPCFWRTTVINAIIARDQAYLGRYDSFTDPTFGTSHFEIHCGPRGESDTTYTVTAGPGYSNANWATSWASWMASMVGFAPHCQYRAITNFMPGGWSAMDTLIQQAATYRCAVGGPDVYTRFVTTVPQPYATDFGMVYHGYTKTGGGGTTWVLNGTDYSATGTYCQMHDVQDPEMGGKENSALDPNLGASVLYNQGVTNGDHYLFWWMKEFCWGAPNNAWRQLYWLTASANRTGELNGAYTPDISGFLTGNAAPLNTNRPSYYP